jgi:transcriptional/translational regulatory protein YebC/TACO1
MSCQGGVCICVCMQVLEMSRPFVPTTRVEIGDKEAVEAIEDLVESVEELDDVQIVYHNAALPT